MSNIIERKRRALEACGWRNITLFQDGDIDELHASHISEDDDEIKIVYDLNENISHVSVELENDITLIAARENTVSVAVALSMIENESVAIRKGA
jgi:hypothetical protein